MGGDQTVWHALQLEEIRIQNNYTESKIQNVRKRTYNAILNPNKTRKKRKSALLVYILLSE